MSPSLNPFEPPRPPASAAEIESIDPAASRYAPCPRCGQNVARQLSFTLWGGVLGAKLFTHVKCRSCGTKYNGKTGGYNTLVIVCYTVGSIVIGILVALAAALMLSF